MSSSNESVRAKIRSKALQQLSCSRGKKKATPKVVEVNKDDSEYVSRFSSNEEDDPRKAQSSNSLVAILPRPKNSSAHGPSIMIEKFLKMPKLIDMKDMKEQEVAQLTSEDFNPVKNLTLETSGSRANNVVVPKGMAKQKNQITYLAQLSKATELEQKEKASLSRINKSAARAKYGW